MDILLSHTTPSELVPQFLCQPVASLEHQEFYFKTVAYNIASTIKHVLHQNTSIIL